MKRLEIRWRSDGRFEVLVDNSVVLSFDEKALKKAKKGTSILATYTQPPT